MKKFASFALLIIFLVLPLGVYGQQGPDKKLALPPPKASAELPDYKKAPFAQVEEDAYWPMLHPERPSSWTFIYDDKGDTTKLHPDENIIAVFLDEKGQPTYLEWIHIDSKDIDKFKVRSYTLKDGAWIFEQEADMKQPKQNEYAHP